MFPWACWPWSRDGAGGSSCACRPRPASSRVASGLGRSRWWASSSCSTGKAELKYLRFALLALGVALLAALVVQNDPAAVLGSIVDLSWRLVIVLCFPVALVMLFDTLGWRFAFLREAVDFRALVVARLAGEAFNLTTPTAALGGEAVKAWLLRSHAPIDASLASVIVAKTTITLAQALYLLLGVVVAWRTVLSGSLLLYGMLWLLAIEAVALAGFVLVPPRGLPGGGRRRPR